MNGRVAYGYSNCGTSLPALGRRIKIVMVVLAKMLSNCIYLGTISCAGIELVLHDINGNNDSIGKVIHTSCSSGLHCSST